MLPPLVPPGLENVRSGQLEVVLRRFEVMNEEWQHNLVSKELARLGCEPHVAELLAVTHPATMRPRPHDQRAGCLRTLRLDGAVYRERTGQILGVEPTADRQHRRMDILQMRADVACLPVLVITPVFQQFFPECRLRAE